MILAALIWRRSTACQAVDRANIAVTVDRHKLTVIQQNIGLITPVAVEPGNGIARFNQQVGQFLAQIGLSRDQVGERLPALRVIAETEQAAAAVLVERRAVTALEYGLIASLIAVTIITAVTATGTKLSAVFNTVSSHL